MSTTGGHVDRPSTWQRVSAAIYDRMNGGMEKKVFGERRHRLLEAAQGSVLDRNIEAAGFVFESVEGWLEAGIPFPLVRPQLLAAARKPAGERAESGEAEPKPT